MNDRIGRLAEKLYDYRHDAMFYERMTLLEEARKQHAGMTPGEVYANSLVYLLDNITVDILPDEHLAGRVKEIVPDEAQEAEFDRLKIDNNYKLTPHFSFEALRLATVTDPDDRYAPLWFGSYGHCTPDMARVLRLGFDGIKQEAEERLRDQALTDKQTLFLQNTIAVCEAMGRYGKRYAKKAEQLAAEASGDDAERLTQIAEMMDRIPGQPASGFRGAVEMIWLVHMTEAAIVGARDYAFGRVDQYLYPYYKKDIESGKITREYAKELLQELFVKLNELIGRAMEDYDQKRVLQVNSLHYMIIAGTDENGNEVTNDVSFLMLEAIEELDMCKQPTMILRWFPGINNDFMNLAMRLVSNGRGFPTFVDERKTYEALVWYGVDEKAAHDFVFYGCNNICMPGNSDQLMEVWHNAGKYMELALNQGRCAFTGKKYGAETPPASQMKDMEDLWEAFRAQLGHCLMIGRQDLWSWDQAWARLRPFSFESVIDTHCVERAESVNEGGGDFKHYNNHFSGLATVANSFYAIKKLVFEEKQMTLPALLEILGNNWEGQELLRARVMNKFEKYGNNQDEVDDIAVRIGNMFIEEVKALPDFPNGRKAYADIYSLYHHRLFGRDVAATADGRMAHEQLSESVSGTYGTEKDGITSALRSAAKLAHNRTPSDSNNIKIQPAMVATQEGKDRLRAVIETYFGDGGSQLQINVVDNGLMEDARKHPEKHKNLLVRVVGFSAYYVHLAPEQQQEIIDRNTLA